MAKFLNSQSWVGMSILFSTGSAISAGLVEQHRRRLEKKRTDLDNKMKNIYAPLKGNRLLHQASIKAVEARNDCSVEEKVRRICKTADKEALENWRGFYVKFLAPLDKEAQMIIKQYAYLVNDDECQEIFNQFLQTSAAHQYQMEYWFNEKGRKQ